MADLDRLKSIIKQSSELSKLGEDEKALTLLDDALIAARQENRAMWIHIIAHHAAVISDSMGDIQRVRRYYEQSISSNPENPRALYGLARVMERQGEKQVALQTAEKCYKLVSAAGCEIDRTILDLLLDSWPQLAQS
jgi:tetratricopeptide (TPR) repeat protein